MTKLQPDDKTPIGGLSLYELEAIIKRVRKYTGAPRFPSSLLDGVYALGGGDTEGHPYEQTLTLLKDRKDGDTTKSLYLWQVVIGYEEVSGDDFDFKEVVRADRNTAYKTRPPGPPEEVKFKLMNWWSQAQSAATLELAYREIVEIDAFLRELDEKTKDIAAWSESGLDVHVSCKKCSRTNRITNEKLSRLAASGLSLSDFENRLSCTKCETRTSRIRPIPAI